MKYIIFLNDKPIEEATPEERKELEEKVKKVFEKYLGLKYIGKKKIWSYIAHRRKILFERMKANKMG